jgi:hypothetical protein
MVSKYLDRLNKKYGLIRKEDRIPKKNFSKLISIQEYGNAAIIEEEFFWFFPGQGSVTFPGLYWVNRNAYQYTI